MLCWVNGGIKLSLSIFKNGLAKKNGQQTSIFDFFFFLGSFCCFCADDYSVSGLASINIDATLDSFRLISNHSRTINARKTI